MAGLGALCLLVVSPLAHAGGNEVIGPRRVHSNVLQVAGPNQSTNWGGYNQGMLEKASASNGFHSIGGDWVVPTASQRTAGQSEYSSSWIGIGGGCDSADCSVTDSTLIQTGTEQDVVADSPTKWHAEYSAWFELVPLTSETVSLPVSPGDHMHASIVEDPTTPELWTITLTNVTQGQSFTTTTPYTSTYGTAEWIDETPVVFDPSSPSTAGFSLLPNLTQTHFTNATANGAPAGLTADEKMLLVDGSNNPVATPSDPNAAGTAFDVCSYAATCTLSGSGGGGGPTTTTTTSTTSTTSTTTPGHHKKH